MQACRFKSTRSPAHSHLSIVQIRRIHNVPHAICNVWAQRSHKLRSRIHTALVGTILVPISQSSNGCSILYTKICEFLSLMPPEDLLRNQIVAGAVPDASTLWSTCSCRPSHSFLETPQVASTDPQYLQASFHKLIQTTQ